MNNGELRCGAIESHPNGRLLTIEGIASTYTEARILIAERWADISTLVVVVLFKAHRKEGLAFTTFVPNAFYHPGLATNVAFWMLNRARWVRQTRWPDLEDKRMIEILEGRFGGRPWDSQS